MLIKTQSKIDVKRPEDQLERQISYQEWLLKIKSNYYAQHGRVVDACARII